MDEILQQLLATEEQAERLVAEARAERAATVAAAEAEAQALEDTFEQQIAAIRASHLEKAEARAAQAIAELNRRYDEENQQLRAAAQENRQAALSAALQAFKPGASD